MRINEFTKKYGFDRRRVDYWTSLGYIHTDGVEEGNKYRNYGARAEEEAESILILLIMDWQINSENIEMIIHGRRSKEFVNKIIIPEVERKTQEIIDARDKTISLLLKDKEAE